MIGQVILYALVASAALTAAGLCLERLALLRGWSLRWVWISAIAVSIGYPLVAIIGAPRAVEGAPVKVMDVPGSPALPVIMTPPADAGLDAAPESASEPASIAPAGAMVATAPATAGETEGAVPDTVASPSQRTRAWLQDWRMPSDRSLVAAWVVTSCALWGYLLIASLLLGRRADAWPRTSLRGQPLLLSDSIGPALLGCLSPRIVVPRWFLDEPADTQALVIEHELQHLQARDPLLLRVALLAVAAVPWNLPLWWQLRRLRLSIELDCDARVLGTGAEAGAYGEVLLSVTRRAALAPVGVVAMAQRASSLELRIRHLVRMPAPRARLQAAGSLVLAALLTAGAVALEAPALPPRAQAPQADAQLQAQPQTRAQAQAQGQTQTPPTAVPAQAAPGQPPYVMPVPSMPGMAANGMMGGTLQTALERYPEILTGRDAEGLYAVVLVLNADGSVHASDMRFTTRERVLLVDEEMSAALPPDSSGSNTTTYSKGRPLPGGGTLRNDLRLSTRVLPADFDPSRSLALVQKAVEEKHGDLMHDPLQGDIAVVTVLMTDDGRIARDHVEHIKREEMRVKLPREAEARHFAVLGVQPAALGRIGLGFVTRRTGDTTPVPLRDFDDTLQPGGVLEMLMVLYAWPQRAGDPPLTESTPVQDSQPIAATPAPGHFLPATRAPGQSGPGSASFNAQSRRVEERALAALLETYPEILRDAGREGTYTAALALRPDGSVFRSGLRFSADNAETSRHMQELNPLLQQGGVTSTDIFMKGELLPSGARLPNRLTYQFTVLPLGLDEARAEQLVREALLARHADLLLPVSSGVTNLVTVMMTDDGRIARHSVRFGPTQEIMRSSGRPEDFDFESLGIRAEDVGVYGMLILGQQDAPGGPVDAARAPNSWRQMMVRYAWPRRAGEPVGGYPKPPQDLSAQGRTTQMPAAQQDQAAALAARYFPEVLADPAAHAGVRPWVLLSNQGAVVRTGRATLGQDEPFVASMQLGRQMPGAQFTEVEFHRLPAAGGRVVSVAFVWLAAGSTVQ